MLRIDQTQYNETPRPWFGRAKDLSETPLLQWRAGQVLAVDAEGFLVKATFPLAGIVAGVAVGPYRGPGEVDYYKINDSTIWIADTVEPPTQSMYLHAFNLEETEDGELVIDNRLAGTEVRVVGFFQEILTAAVGYATFDDARPDFSAIQKYVPPIQARFRFLAGNSSFVAGWR